MIQKIKQTIPNALTSGNLLCGCIGIVFSLSGNLEYAAIMIWIAGLFDFLDGFSARLLKVSSEIGKQLDSLADMVTFGVLPGMILYQLILHTDIYTPALSYFAFTIAIFSALRLAKFNIDTRQSDIFIGLPTPANALCVSAFPFILEGYEMQDNLQVLILLLSYTFVFSWLLIAEIEMLALKFKSWSWGGNEARWIFLIIGLTLVVSLKVIAIPVVIIVYVVTSIVNNMIKSNSR